MTLALYTCCARALDIRRLATVGLTALRVLSMLSLLKLRRIDISQTSHIMSIVRPGPSEPNKVVIEETSFNYIGSDIVLRSYDSRDFPLPKLYILICSPVFESIIRSVSNTSDIPNGDGPRPFPIVKLPESGATL